MSLATCSDEQFIQLLSELGPTGAAIALGVTERAVYYRRNRIERRTNTNLALPPTSPSQRGKTEHSARLAHEMVDGCILVGSDAHYWPGEITTAHRAFVRACYEMQPDLVVMNGDMFDGASISRHAPIGWETRPTVADEIAIVQERLREIRQAAGDARLVWTLGNHDARFETRLATVAPEYAKVHGVHLKDHFPDWEPCWSIWVNDDIVIKHRFKGGIHAPHNNTLWAGKTIVTGHLHSPKVIPHTDYNGTRYGVDTGTMANPNGQQFIHYTEDNPRSWRSGFGVFSFRDGRLLTPELVLVWDEEAGEVQFRGKIWKV